MRISGCRVCPRNKCCRCRKMAMRLTRPLPPPPLLPRIQHRPMHQLTDSTPAAAAAGQRPTAVVQLNWQQKGLAEVKVQKRVARRNVPRSCLRLTARKGTTWSTRTCEVTGVEKLGLLRVAADCIPADCVSADRWAPLEEVAPEALCTWLRSMRDRGYTIVGVEQTATSVPLHQYRFPERAVLVLGKEREGIPPSVLHMMDACVSIPQRGIIRSLNVHVCGAMVLWY